MNLTPGIWLVRPDSEPLAGTLQNRLGGMLYRPWLNSAGTQKDQFAAAYRLHRQWIMIAASGIAVRFLDGLPQDKHSDPAVVDEAGRRPVPKLGSRRYT